MTESRILRVARGSGRQVKDVTDMLEEYKRLAKMWSKLNVSKLIPPNGKMSDQAIQKMLKAMPPQVVQQMGGKSAFEALVKQMGGKDMSKMLAGMKGGA